MKMMLEFLGEKSAGHDIDKALSLVTPMNLERMSTKDIAKAVLENI